jgi:hypothetical protein
MPAAFCNICNELVYYSRKRLIKHVQCECGNTHLIAVTGTWNDKGGFDYYDRSGRFIKYVPQDTFLIQPEKIMNGTA